MSLNLQILMLLHRKYKPSASMGMQSGQFDLLIFTDIYGYPMRVHISLSTFSNSGRWYARRTTHDGEDKTLRYFWETEAH